MRGSRRGSDPIKTIKGVPSPGSLSLSFLCITTATITKGPIPPADFLLSHPWNSEVFHCFSLSLQNRDRTQSAWPRVHAATRAALKRSFWLMAGKNQALPSAESVAVGSGAEEMQSGLQCVTLAAVGRRSQLPVKIRARTPNVNV